MITNTFDDKTEAIISPKSFYKGKKKICETCIITFSNSVIDNVLQTFRCEKIADMVSTNGLNPKKHTVMRVFLITMFQQLIILQLETLILLQKPLKI